MTVNATVTRRGRVMTNEQIAKFLSSSWKFGRLGGPDKRHHCLILVDPDGGG
ncbi:hypothetical protein ACHAXA_011507 [Cyclostephanos tholiformis]|uniref:Uncharacterized protein n=1 Tax=Cyclostephanos tholiformis TaxID=382380 RepID=A0ABD3SDX4_9STRA